MIVFINIVYTCLETSNAIILIVNKDLDSLTDNMTHMFTHLLSSYKLYTLMTNYTKITNWCKVMETDVYKYKSCPGFYPQKLVKEYAKRVTFISICLGCFCTGVITSYTIRGIITKKILYYDDFNQTRFIRKIPYHMYFPYDTNIRPVYDFTFIYQTFGIYLNAVLLTGFDGVMSETVLKRFFLKITLKISDFRRIDDNEFMPFKNPESSSVEYQEKSNIRNKIERKSKNGAFGES